MSQATYLRLKTATALMVDSLPVSLPYQPLPARPTTATMRRQYTPPRFAK